MAREWGKKVKNDLHFQQGRSASSGLQAFFVFQLEINKLRQDKSPCSASRQCQSIGQGAKLNARIADPRQVRSMFEA